MQGPRAPPSVPAGQPVPADHGQESGPYPPTRQGMLLGMGKHDRLAIPRRETVGLAIRSGHRRLLYDDIPLW